MLWMIERGQHLRLTFESREAIGIECKRFRQDLERDISIKLRVARAVHLTHAASADGGNEFVGPKSTARHQSHAR